MFKYFLIFLLFNIAHGYEFLNATQLESPWYAYLMVLGEPCGGTLVQDRYIISAAHCFNKVKKDHYTNEEGMLEASVQLKLGIWKTDKDPDCDPGVDEQICEYHVEIPPNELKVHERYNPNSGRERFKNDIAIIQLTWPPRKSELISSIDLPDDDDCENDFEDDVWTVTGFGQKPDKDYATTKKKIDMKMISPEECEDGLGDAKQYYDKKTHICGKGTRGETTCVGDSGSGVFVKSTNGATLQGIVSFGVSECGVSGAPSGFVRVACYNDWINEKIEEFESDDEVARSYPIHIYGASRSNANSINKVKSKKRKSKTGSGLYGLFQMFGYF